MDDCGVCDGDGSSCADCAGVPNGDSAEDCAGTCVEGWLFGYLGDGWCDGSDAAWGIDLSCYDCDNGDCSGACGCEDSDSCNDCCGEPNGDNACSGSGDVNGDGSLDVLDLTQAVGWILGLSEAASACEIVFGDINGDGSINVLDVVALVSMILRN